MRERGLQPDYRISTERAKSHYRLLLGTEAPIMTLYTYAFLFWLDDLPASALLAVALFG